MKKELVCIFLSLLLLAGCSGKDGKTNENGTSASISEESGISNNGKTVVGDTDDSSSLAVTDPSEITATGTDVTIDPNNFGESDPSKITNTGTLADNSQQVPQGSQSPENPEEDNIEEPVTIGVTIPPIPEEGLPDVPSDKVKFTDDSVVIYEDDDGSVYVNGEPITPEEEIEIIQQIASNYNSQIIETTTTTTSASPSVITPPATTPSTTTTKPVYPDITLPNDTSTQTTRPEGTIHAEEDIFYLAKYVKTGNTDLAITDIKVYSSARPGVEGVDSFKPGESMLINLLCNPEARMDSKIYIVPEGAEHKDSYASFECLYSENMFIAFESGEGQLFMDITLPDSIAPGVYEVRFVCGTEEGYIPFHLG